MTWRPKLHPLLDFLDRDAEILRSSFREVDGEVRDPEILADLESIACIRRIVEAHLEPPDVSEFIAGVAAEAQHQLARWGAEHDDAKGPEDWFWTLGYLGGKALAAVRAGDVAKVRHHLISSAALLANQHRRLA